MSKKYTIQITEQDIANGIRNSPCHCPIALATKRLFPKEKIEVRLALYLGWRVFLLSKEAKDFIYYADNGKPLNPTTFDVEELGIY